MRRRAEKSLVYSVDIFDLCWRIALSMAKIVLERVTLAKDRVKCEVGRVAVEELL